jgi:hypothetical protein
MKHIESNIVVKFRLTKPVKEAMWKACQAMSCSRWTQYMHQVVQEENWDICQYLLSIPWDQWATAHATCPKWGETTSNASESANNRMGDVCDGNILDLHAGLVGRCMKQLHLRSKKYNKNMDAHLPPEIESKLERVKAKGAALRLVLPGPDGWFLVKTEGGNEFEVNIGNQEPQCTCKEYNQNRFPCAHMAAVFFSLHGPRGEDFHRFVHHVYTTESLRAAYSGKILPCAVDGNLIPDNVTRPPARTKPTGRPPNLTRIPSRGERNPEDSPIVCSNCGRRGHNRRTCRYVRRDDE